MDCPGRSYMLTRVLLRRKQERQFQRKCDNGRDHVDTSARGPLPWDAGGRLGWEQQGTDPPRAPREEHRPAETLILTQ